MPDKICVWCEGKGCYPNPAEDGEMMPCRGCGGSGREGVRGPAYGPPEPAPEDVAAYGPASLMAMDDNALGQRFLGAPATGNPLTLDEYQRLAARTICDQAKALERVGGLSSVAAKGGLSSVAAEVGAEEGNFPSLVPIQLMHSLIGIQNEAGEIAKIIQGWIYYGKGLSQEALIEEYGDLLWYVAEGLTAICVSMGAVGAGNIAKLRARYPDRYTDEAAANRDPEAEAAAMRAGAARSAGTIPAKVDLDEDSRHRREDQKKDGQDTMGVAVAVAGGKSVDALRALEAMEFVRKYGGRPDPCQSCGGSGARLLEGLRTETCPDCGGSGRASEPCCDCGKPYPRVELVAGHVFCRACRARGALGAPPEDPDLPPLRPAGVEGPPMPAPLSPPTPPVLPPDACQHCRGAGQVNCEWAPGMTSPCPKCGGSGKSRHGGGAAPCPAAEVYERCLVCEQRWRRFYFVDPGPCPACGAPYGGRLREEEGPLMDPNVTGTQSPPRHPLCPDGHDWQPGSCLPGSSRRCRRCGAPE
jgi:NTP pyrophosphatase (non-canonical NTP hydrolase)